MGVFFGPERIRSKHEEWMEKSLRYKLLKKRFQTDNIPFLVPNVPQGQILYCFAFLPSLPPYIQNNNVEEMHSSGKNKT